jgi:hypothetical protein
VVVVVVMVVVVVWHCICKHNVEEGAEGQKIESEL